MHFLDVRLQDIFALKISITNFASPCFDLVRFNRMLEHQGFWYKSLATGLAREWIWHQTCLLLVDLQPDVGSEFPSAFVTCEFFFEVSFSNVLQQSPLACVAFVTMWADEFTLLQMNSLHMLSEVIFSCKSFSAKLALLQLLTVTVLDMLLQCALTRISLETNSTFKITFSNMDSSRTNT